MLFLEKNLEGKILIASPTISENSYFSKTVIYILRNSTDGSVGLIINQPLPKLEGNLVVRHEGKAVPLKFTKAYSGGPVEIEKGFVLHLDSHVRSEVEPLIKLSFDIEFISSVSILSLILFSIKLFE